MTTHRLGLPTVACRLPTVLIVLALVTALHAQTGEHERVESQTRRASERLLALQREADALAAEQRSLLVDLRRLEVDRNLRTEQLAQAEADTRNVTRDLDNLGNQIDEFEETTRAVQPLIASRMVELYKLGSSGYMRLLLGASDLQEFGRAYRMVSAMTVLDRQRADQYRRDLVRLRAAHQTLEQRRAELTRLQRAGEAARAAAARASLERARLINAIDERRDLTAALAGELQETQVKLQQRLAAISAGAPREAADGSALPIRPFRGDLDWPVAGRMLTPFGRSGPRTSAIPMQSGTQFTATDDSPVRAVHDGTVVHAGPLTPYGNLVILYHGAQAFSLYGQLGAVQVEQGAAVERGHVLGRVGRILAGIPGLYFEIRIDGQPVDPLEWLRKQP